MKYYKKLRCAASSCEEVPAPSTKSKQPTVNERASQSSQVPEHRPVFTAATVVSSSLDKFNASPDFRPDPVVLAGHLALFHVFARLNQGDFAHFPLERSF